VSRIAFVAVLVLALAACGGSGKPKTSNDQAQIKSAYETFFSGKTSIPDRVALLQNGPMFKSVVSSFASNPLAKGVAATVSSVTLEGTNKAKVVYAVSLGGSSLPKQTGTAVRENGTWKVGDASLCKLIALSGSTPAVCKNP
jgi:hypothetical protein